MRIIKYDELLQNTVPAMLLSIGLYFLLAFHHFALGDDTGLKEEILQEMRLMLNEFQVRLVCRKLLALNISKTFVKIQTKRRYISHNQSKNCTF